MTVTAVEGDKIYCEWFGEKTNVVVMPSRLPR